MPTTRVQVQGTLDFRTAMPTEKGSKMPWLESLYDMLADTKHSDIIRWDESGTEIVFHAEKLPTVLSRFFRSQELESFEKQLRNYEFKLHQKGTQDRPTKYKHPLCTRDARAYAVENVTSKSERQHCRWAWLVAARGFRAAVCLFIRSHHAPLQTRGKERTKRFLAPLTPL